jgi:transcriptional regulator with XRE-family HTH domain
MSTKSLWLSKRLREIREKRGITQYALAKQSGVTKQAIGRLEAGSAVKPTWETVQLLAIALGVDCRYFQEPDVLERAGPNSAKKTRRPRRGKA